MFYEHLPLGGLQLVRSGAIHTETLHIYDIYLALGTGHLLAIPIGREPNSVLYSDVVKFDPGSRDTRFHKHYKGGVYTQLGYAIDPSLGVRFVYYMDVDGGAWIRPYKMFVGNVEHEGKEVPRFVEL